ncbi:MAG TPA: helix-turn-helix domain-containing protein [Candidatus Elarobacter sp.]
MAVPPPRPHVRRRRALPQGAKRTPSVPAIFSTVARTEILMLLAVNGPIHVRELARLRRVDSASTIRTVDRLIEAKLVAKRDRNGARPRSTAATAATTTSTWNARTSFARCSLDFST